MFSQDENRNKIQHCCLNILSAIVDVCEEYNLTYYLCGGTLLGAIRHQGFIPWDDDIDIYMPRKDYERFIRIANGILPEHYAVDHYTQYKDTQKPTIHQAQVVDKNTTLIRDWAAKETEINVWVDIFPLDGMPNGRFLRNLHYYHYLFWYIIMKVSWFEELVNLNKPGRPFHEKMMIKFIQVTHLGRSWNTIRILNRIEKILQKYEYDNSDWIVSMHGAYRKKEILPKKWLAERVKIPFEDKEFYIPKEYNDILHHYYDDYMTPPKTREQKEGHHQIKIVTLDKNGDMGIN